ncbi:hypothetical protein BCR37DRAFT_389341 [Protomyces lactucae-debilis]|uniref:Uncharacterized protein n=1 Tax=Protomyces lactucae-debilis TaxID=2754530 RepID=A0A1Y2EZD3_PROLT|nr:uncharacterized protein BCR37DRAFT_389341 [Protomyces lactucae-debilis]ORY76624.1 hypothetical protein BCR37DRAFT_389341 [Protomyces lactucae-debilis]
MLSQSLLTALAFSTVIVAQPMGSDTRPQTLIQFPLKRQEIQCNGGPGSIYVKAKDMAASFKDGTEAHPAEDENIPQSCQTYGKGVFVVSNSTVPCQSSQQHDFLRSDPTRPKHIYCQVSLWGWKNTDGPKTLVGDIKKDGAICAITATDAPHASLQDTSFTPCENAPVQN